jgi:hypothetical protein
MHVNLLSIEDINPMLTTYEAPRIDGCGTIIAETLGTTSGATHENTPLNMFNASGTVGSKGAETASDTVSTASSGVTADE